MLTTFRLAIARISVVAAALAFAPAQAADTPREVVDAYHEALRVGDSAAALSLLARHSIVFEMGLAQYSRRDYAQAHLLVDMQNARATRMKRLSRRVGGGKELHWVVSVYEVSEGPRLLGTQAETVLLAKRDDRWQIVHVHWSENPVPTPPKKR